MDTELTFDVYVSPAKPVPSQVPAFDAAGGTATWPATTATLISGARNSVLVDTLMTRAETAALSAWVAAHGRQLRDVYVTHPHADHLYGLGAILADFPGARGITQHRAVEAMVEQVGPAYLAVWESFFPGQLPEDLRVPAAVAGDEVDLDGCAIRFVDVGRTDTEPSSVVHIPELATVVSGDVAYNGIHAWLAGSTPASRTQWMSALDTLEALAPRHIVAGHKDPSAPDDDAVRILDETRRYLTDFDDAVVVSGSPRELVDRMLARHGGLGNAYTLWLAAWDQLGQAS